MSYYPVLATIAKEYFTENSGLVEVLQKDSRLYLGIIIELNDNKCFIPLRSHISYEPKYKKAGFPLPTATRPNAGLDYRKLLIINEESYIIFLEKVLIPQTQKETIYQSVEQITREVNRYIKTYVKEYHRGKSEGHFLYRYSTLKNFHAELNILDSEN